MLLITLPDNKGPHFLAYLESAALLIRSVVEGISVCHDQTSVQTTKDGMSWRFSCGKEYIDADESKRDHEREFQDLHALAQVIAILQNAQTADVDLGEHYAHFSSLAHPRQIPEPPKGRLSNLEAATYATSWLLGREVKQPTKNPVYSLTMTILYER